MIRAEVICDSISEQGKRLITSKLRYPKFIHGEFMTHRVISRNASSSRAIPTARLIEEVRSDAHRAAPVFWGKNQSGMQAAEELDDTPVDPNASSGGYYVTPWVNPATQRTAAIHCWRSAALSAADLAEKMMRIGAHKQIVNRLLEPFSHINVVATATEWDNFFGLRLHKDAQPEMRALAIAMWEARKASTPKLLKPGEWHLPFVSDDERELTWYRCCPCERHVTSEGWAKCGCHVNPTILTKVSVARCARVSYESFETGKRSTVEEDLKLYDRLVGAQPLHASPAEHQATPDTQWVEYEHSANPDGDLTWHNPEQHGNFVGWRQYRKTLPGEAVAPLPEEFR